MTAAVVAGRSPRRQRSSASTAAGDRPSPYRARVKAPPVGLYQDEGRADLRPVGVELGRPGQQLDVCGVVVAIALRMAARSRLPAR